tara:strand:- start:33002 stop:34210 length:1209 start_codon:yes stop_codon:yes gene_type:complete
MSDSMFSDLKVIDCGSYIAGPAAATIMADFGADVIKIEPPGAGDPYRYVPSIPGTPNSEHNYGWLLDSRNKRGLALDLGNPQGREVLHRLAREADVFVSNYPAAVRNKLGLDYDTLAALNERLIYASFSGYGEVGAEATKPGFDVTAWWARSGMMDQVRAAADAPPVRPVVGMGDHPSAVALYAAIASALYQRERTGKGMKVSSSLLANGLWANAFMVQAALCGATFVPRPAREDGLNALTSYFQCRDGKWLILTILNEERHWPVLARCLEREDLLEDPRFVTKKDRQGNSTVLIAELDEAFAQRDRESWQEDLNAQGIIFEIVATPGDLPADPQVKANGLAVPFADDESLYTVDSPFTISGIEKVRPVLPPAVGQHTDDVLAEVGYGPDEIAQLRADGAVA